MAYNTTHPAQRSINLENLDCNLNVKHVPVDDAFPEGVWVASATKIVGVGQCVSMIRVAAGTTILGAEFFWDDAAPAAVVAIGDPFGCARLLGPIHTGTARGVINASTCSGFTVWGACGSLAKMGTTGDGCGYGYRYTCETDIVMTNLYSDRNATAGGWAGSDLTLGSQVSVAISAGTYRLNLHVKKTTSNLG